ncbi:DUF4166 domain-containing protein [Paenibacillus glucanolyticus]|jgi:hypothetical protein|uniref:DUF4166 domain-containing protein n=1 Tax=Paenibacillus TaxID=44249 RepID=UPI0011639862|nr:MULTISPECIES: DUF4166 domain-containing protein [Paenibacillus]AWP27091.1 hypothetical protein B9D94_10870 [Paenibacillus sp. Cedars]MDH6670479.1 hypothetical protein [Paenibacillus sp. LBL]MPY18291.1 DUF4166 domain-containing protein [Paenibacillus glucanolyticus]
MTSIYEQALGAQFQKLHPKIRERFGFNSKDNIASIGEGIMEEIWHAPWAVLPLYIGTMRHIMFPNRGMGIPFRIENYAYQDEWGRETVTWCRSFDFPGIRRRFDATMIYSSQRSRVVDYLGNQQHLAVDLAISASANGGIRIQSSEQRFYEGILRFRFPRCLTGTADVCEWYEERDECYRISVQVNNPILGPVFRYKGSFQARTISLNGQPVPSHVKPLRTEVRE